MRVDSNTCDVRGLRVDDALSMVDAFLDRLLGEDNTAGFVLHGHGTGVLKSRRARAPQAALRTSAAAARPTPRTGETPSPCSG
jgi:hypothetical protein